MVRKTLVRAGFVLVHAEDLVKALCDDDEECYVYKKGTGHWWEQEHSGHFGERGGAQEQTREVVGFETASAGELWYWVTFHRYPPQLGEFFGVADVPAKILYEFHDKYFEYVTPQTKQGRVVRYLEAGSNSLQVKVFFPPKIKAGNIRPLHVANWLGDAPGDIQNAVAPGTRKLRDL